MAKKKTSLVDSAKRLNASREPGDGAADQQEKKSTKSSSSSSPKDGGQKKSAPRAKSSGSSSSRAKPGSGKKKTPAAKSPKKQETGTQPATTNARDQIISDVVEIARGLDDAGLELLREQAKVVRYKGQIEEFNRQLNTAAGRAAEARREANRPDYAVTIERNDDYFIIQMDDARVFFNLGEMRELTRICHKAKDPAAGARLLFRWFEKERSDLLADAAISAARSPYLFELYELIVSTYKVKS